jgi:hypothetical protein
MPGRDHSRIPAALLCCLLLGSCASTIGPQDWLLEPGDTASDAHGGWLEISHASKTETPAQLRGELIAIHADSVFLAADALYALSRSDIESARLVMYNSNAGAMAGLVGLGTVSTLSNGAFLLFTAPLWLIGGNITVSARSSEPILSFPKHKWAQFVPYARFPQGLPAGIARSSIKMKRAAVQQQIH